MRKKNKKKKRNEEADNLGPKLSYVTWVSYLPSVVSFLI